MGEQKVNTRISEANRADFIRHLLDDIQALDIMLEEGLIENGITRIGAEQEFCLINNNWRPANNAVDILQHIDDPHATTELARYNLEINLDPFELKGDAFSLVEQQLRTLLDKACESAKAFETKILLTGILPTISKNELDFEYMTPFPRYWALNDMIKALRGSDFDLHLRGVDELSITHDSVLFEACNTSFQLHLQVSPDDFIAAYNWAQAISGPILAIACNSPLLLGRELWSETRIGLFQQSIDTRKSSYALREQRARVSFGDRWAEGSIANLFKDDIATHKMILARDIESHALTDLKAGKAPKLQALNLHNGTVYHWNRPCYGVGGGKAHLRIENRYLPSGPSVIDEMANFALWVGLMVGRPEKFDDMPAVMNFRDAKANFIKASRTGKESVMFWEGESIYVKRLMLDILLPIAHAGLAKVGIDQADIDRLLGVIEARIHGFSGSQWMIRNYRKLREHMKTDDALLALTKSIYDNQVQSLPVHQWPLLDHRPKTHEAAYQVRHIMSTQLFTVREKDLAELATSVMLWKNIHHLPVEDDDGNLCGLLTWTHMKKFKAQHSHHASSLVSDIMVRDVHTAKPETLIQDAVQLMKKHEIGCLPVVHDRHLVGIITIKDLTEFANGRGAQQGT